MDKGSAEIFGSRICNSMLSNRKNRNTISQTEEINNKNGVMRSSMVTPR
jgi:hypothetical protein